MSTLLERNYVSVSPVVAALGVVVIRKIENIHVIGFFINNWTHLTCRIDHQK